MKKLLSLLLITVLLLGTVMPLAAADDITVLVDGKQVEFDVPPQIINGRTMVPLRAIFNALGATVTYDSATKTVSSQKGFTKIQLTIDDPVMYVNGTAKTLDTPGTIVVGRTLVPLRAIGEAYNATVKWDGSSRTAYITSSPKGTIKLLSYNYVRINGNLYDVVNNGAITNDIYYLDKAKPEFYLNPCSERSFIKGNAVTYALLTKSYVTTTTSNPFLYGSIDTFMSDNTASIHIKTEKVYTSITEFYLKYSHSFNNRTLEIPLEVATYNWASDANRIKAINGFRYDFAGSTPVINLEDYCKFFSLNVELDIEYNEELKQDILVVNYN